MVNSQDDKKLEKITKKRIQKWLPNRCMTVYKNRGGEYTKCKIWLYVDMGTMRVHDLFCTDEEYNLLDIPQSFTKVMEDQKVVFSNNKEELFGKMIEDTVDITEAALAEESYNAFDDSDEVEAKIVEELDKQQTENEIIENHSTEQAIEENSKEENKEEPKEVEAPPKRKRGRPRKNPVEEPTPVKEEPKKMEKVEEEELEENEPFWEMPLNKKLETVIDPDLVLESEDEEEKASRTESEEFVY